MFKAKDLVSAGLYSREEDVLRDALRFLLWIRPGYRLEGKMVPGKNFPQRIEIDINLIV